MNQSEEEKLKYFLEYASVMESQYKKEISKEKITQIQERYQKLMELANMYDGRVDTKIHEEVFQVRMIFWCPSLTLVGMISQRERKIISDLMKEDTTIYIMPEQKGISITIDDTWIEQVVIQDRAEELQEIRKKIKAVKTAEEE